MKFNRSIQRCLLLLQQFDQFPRPTLAELTNATKLPRATVLRILITLEEEGYVSRHENKWRLTVKMLDLGFVVLKSMGVNDLIQTTIQNVATKYDGTSNIGEKDNDSVLIIARALASAERQRLHIANLRVGSKLLSDSALYKALDTKNKNIYAERFYEPVNQLSLAVRIPNDVGRYLSLGVSLSKDVCDSEDKKMEIVNYLIDEAKKLGRVLDSEHN